MVATVGDQAAELEGRLHFGRCEPGLLSPCLSVEAEDMGRPDRKEETRCTRNDNTTCLINGDGAAKVLQGPLVSSLESGLYAPDTFDVLEDVG